MCSWRVHNNGRTQAERGCGRQGTDPGYWGTLGSGLLIYLFITNSKLRCSAMQLQKLCMNKQTRADERCGHHKDIRIKTLEDSLEVVEVLHICKMLKEFPRGKWQHRWYWHVSCNVPIQTLQLQWHMSNPWSHPTWACVLNTSYCQSEVCWSGPEPTPLIRDLGSCLSRYIAERDAALGFC